MYITLNVLKMALAITAGLNCAYYIVGKVFAKDFLTTQLLLAT